MYSAVDTDADADALPRHRSSTLGSIAMSPGNLFPVTAYKVSKAALNALTVEYSHQLASEGFIFMALSPGVNTSRSLFFSLTPEVEIELTEYIVA